MKKEGFTPYYTPDIHNLSADLFHRYKPPIEWYAIKTVATGIHGLGHVARVMIWNEVISQLINNKGIRVDQEALRWASAIHDTQRRNDKYDLRHGKRAASWLENNCSHLAISKTTLLKVIHIINNHVNHDGEITMTPELIIFKDADGLDRVRVDDLNPNYLRLDISRKLVGLAKLLFDLSKKQGDLFDNAIAAAIELGLVSK